MSLRERLGRREKASNLPETMFKTLIFSVVLYTGFLFYMDEKYMVATVIFSLLFVLIWGVLDSEIF